MPLDLGPSVSSPGALLCFCVCVCVCVFRAGVAAPGAVHVHTPWPGARTSPSLFTACYSQCTRPTTTTTGETARACVVGCCCCRVPPAQVECGAGRRQCRRAIAIIASGSSRTRARAAAAVACPVSRCAGLCSAPAGHQHPST
jgi:hypothetical protein